jgi:hypothetical protein
LVGVSYLPFQNTKPLFLRIWRDFNQDGISQSEELLTLSDLNILSINLKNKKDNTNWSFTSNVQPLRPTFLSCFSH